MATFGIISIEGGGRYVEYHGSTLLSALVDTNLPNADAWLDGEYVGKLIDAVENDGDCAYKCDGCGRYFQVGDTFIDNSGSEYCYEYCRDKHDYNK